MRRLVLPCLIVWLAGCSGSFGSDTPFDTGLPNDTDHSDDSAADTDTDPRVDTGTGPDTGDHTVYRLQRGDYPVGTVVDVQGVIVTAVAATGIFVQEPTGGPRSGVWVYLAEGWQQRWPDLARGSLVDVGGRFLEYSDSGSTDAVTEIDVAAGGTIAVRGQRTPPDPLDIATSDLADPTRAEPWEGVLVRLSAVTVSDPDLGYGEWAVDGGVRVDDWMHAAFVSPGDQFAGVTGVVHYSFGAHKLEPRDAADLVGRTTAYTGVDELAAGDLVITEVMADPTACVDVACEWIELYNHRLDTVELGGLAVQDGDGHRDRVRGGTLVAPGSYAVIGAARGVSWGYDFTPSGWYGAVGLDEGGDRVQIGVVGDDGAVRWLDEVAAWGTETIGGVATQLSMGVLSATANDDPSAWCAAQATVGSTVDKGTPGQANDVACD